LLDAHRAFLGVDLLRYGFDVHGGNAADGSRGVEDDDADCGRGAGVP
jgi:hypothetical protein